MILLLKLQNNDESLRKMMKIKRKIFNKIDAELFSDKVYLYFKISDIGYYDNKFHNMISEYDKNISSEVYDDEHFEKMFGDKSKTKINNLTGGRF